MDITKEQLLRWSKGDPFDVPEHPDELELMVGYFFDRVRSIVSMENHILKFDGINQVLDCLHDSAYMSGVKIKFYWINGQWFISDVGSSDDILNLPKVARTFSKLYRHHAGDYVRGENESLIMIMESKIASINKEEML